MGRKTPKGRQLDDRALAEEMKITQAAVYEVAAYYTHFDVVKEGGDPCEVRMSGSVVLIAMRPTPCRASGVLETFLTPPLALAKGRNREEAE